MTSISEYVSNAKLSCESCEFEADGPGPAMVHAMTMGHTLSGETAEGDTVTVGIEQDDERS